MQRGFCVDLGLDQRSVRLYAQCDQVSTLVANQKLERTCLVGEVQNYLEWVVTGNLRDSKELIKCVASSPSMAMKPPAT